MHHAPGALALSAAAAASTALVLALDAYGTLAHCVADAAQEEGRIADEHAQLLLPAAFALVALLALLRRLCTPRAAPVAPLRCPATPAGGRLSRELVTPTSVSGECGGSAGDTGYDEVYSDPAADSDADAAPLVSTPAVTRLLSFSCAASPAGSLRSTLGYGSAFKV